MKKVILEVSSPDESMASFLQSWKFGKPERNTRIAFATPELLWQSADGKALGTAQSLMRRGPDVNMRSRPPS